MEVGLCEKCRLFITAYSRYFDSNIPIEYWDLKMEQDFIGYPGLLSKYQEYTKDLKVSYVNGTSICFAGSYGVGKSLTAVCILKKACQKGFSSLYSDMTNIVSILTQAPIDEKYSARQELLAVDFLVIDEIDPRFFSASEASSDLYAKIFESIFRTRRQNKLPTIICTNSPNLTDSFHGSLKLSISSLFADKMETFFVLGSDFRKQVDKETKWILPI